MSKKLLQDDDTEREGSAPPTMAPTLPPPFPLPLPGAAALLACEPRKAPRGAGVGTLTGATAGCWGGACMLPEFCTVLMAELMPLLMADTAMLRAR